MNPPSQESNLADETLTQPPPIQPEANEVETPLKSRFSEDAAFTGFGRGTCKSGTDRAGDVFDASLRAISHRRRTSNTMPQLKLVEFSVELPAAGTVQLAADFTDWDVAPLDMVQFNGGVWSTTVPLPPGIYAYRFLVDGEWYDDPRAVRRDPGHANAFVKVR